MPNFCAAPNCTRKSTQSDLAFFRFPRDPTRCQKWVENCRRADLEDKTADQLNKHYRLCAKHFETSMICRTSPYRTVLRDNAIPTIFDLTSHLNNPHSRHRKRIKELSEDEIRTLKQKKIDETSEQEPKHKEINNSNNSTSKCFNAYPWYPLSWDSSNSIHQRSTMLTCTEVTYLILTHSLLSCIVGESNGNTEGKI
uniref:THAP-type domain-containing protein n=1 Tax=Bos indicus x Bos taurus TaxID=30522 RepID=A0A4W2HK34_BOBOX